MTLSSIQHPAIAPKPTTTTAASRPAADGQRFSDALATIAASVGVTSNDVKQFFAQSPSADTIAHTATRLGLNKDEVTQFLDFAAYGGPDHAARASAVESFMQQHAQQFGIVSNGKIQAHNNKAVAAGTGDEKALPNEADIRAFYATAPTDHQITDKAKALGLDAARFVQFQAIGTGMDLQKVSAPVLETMFVESANRLGEDIGGGANGGWTSYYAPKLGRAVSSSEVADFFASNPTKAEIFKKASEYGWSVSAVNNMMVGMGLTKPDEYNKTFAEMDFALYTGDYGYSMDAYGHIIEGGGHVSVESPDGSSTWVPYTGSRPKSA